MTMHVHTLYHVLFVVHCMYRWGTAGCSAGLLLLQLRRT